MDAQYGRWLNGWRKSLTAITQECCEQYWTCPGESTPQNSNYTATYHSSRKLSKLDEPDTQYSAGEVGTNSWVMYSCRPLHMDKQRQDVQLEPTYSSSVPIRDVALRICRKQWTIGKCGERGSGISVLIARHDIYIYNSAYEHPGTQIFLFNLCSSHSFLLTDRQTDTHTHTHTHICIYIYIYIYTHPTHKYMWVIQ